MYSQSAGGHKVLSVNDLQTTGNLFICSGEAERNYCADMINWGLFMNFMFAGYFGDFYGLGLLHLSCFQVVVFLSERQLNFGLKWESFFDKK